MSTPTIQQIVAQIRTALYGKDVRENIAKGIEACYDDISTAATIADAAADRADAATTRANTAAGRSEAINTELGDNADDLILIQQTQPSPIPEFNKLWIKPESDLYLVPTYEEFCAVTNKLEYKQSNNYLTSDSDMVQNEYVAPSGTETENNDYIHTPKISVIPGETIRIYAKVNGSFEVRNMRFVCAYNAGDEAVSASGAENVVGATGYTVPSGITGVILTIYRNTSVTMENIMVTRNYVPTAYEPYFDPYYVATDEFNNISDAFVENEYHDETEIATELTPDYYMPPDGIPQSSDTYSYTQKISVVPGDVIKARNTNGENKTMRFVTAYNGNTAVPAKGASLDTSAFTVPEGIDSVIATVYTSQSVTTIIRERQTVNKVAKYVVSPKPGYFNVTGDLDDGDTLSLPYENAKTNVVVAFSGRITTLNKIIIRKNTGHNYVTLDDTNLTVNCGLGDPDVVTHGLTIGDEVSITLTSKPDAEKLDKIVIESDGEVYTYTNNSFVWIEDNGSFTVESDGSVLTDCVLGWTSRTIDNDLWLFGDSYFSIESDRWLYYLIQDGYTNHFINAYSGESSAYAIKALKNLLIVRSPNSVLWCLGMNDGSDGESAPSQAWKNAYDELVNLSKKYNFNLILSTTPSTPTINNNQKNAIVRESGYQYIDFAKAVNVGTSGEWISGTLYTDNVHTTVKGAKLLYRRALADCPQLTSGDTVVASSQPAYEIATVAETKTYLEIP